LGGKPTGFYRKLTTARTILTAVVCLLPFRGIKPALLNLLGHCVSRSARISFSIVLAERLFVGPKASIGPLNFIRVKRLVMRETSYIGTINLIHGDFSIGLGPEAAIGNRNLINRGFYLGPRFPSSLVLGRMSKITAGHYVNLIAPISFGAYSVLAGTSSQMWTHGFTHHAEGSGRDEHKKPIKIGNNVYIGSMCCIGPGVTLAHHVAIGSHSSVAKSLTEPGLYVSQALRKVGK
jgi:acetyltransferase-like isoleucine patch superfamily enzyme